MWQSDENCSTCPICAWVLPSSPERLQNAGKLCLNYLFHARAREVAARSGTAGCTHKFRTFLGT